MKLIPLGGAEEVGATCTLVEIGGHRILVDAGIRIGQPDSLPDLGRISDMGGIEAILVTHAHTDHTGALPVVHRAFPNVSVWATPGTQAIVNVLFNDALNIMKSRYEVDREVPLYNRELVNSLFSRMQTVQLGQTIKLFGGDLAATFFPAGHILGAACIGLQSDGANGSGVESAFISGDISVTPQLTVGGMLPPVSVDRRFRPQVVMVESTYGNRLHANRVTEERRLVETVAGIVEEGGRVLIPAFAVGRAQEILLILANAMARKAIAPFPVWVDGMVRSVCSVYTQHPFDLATAIRKQILKQGNPFFGETVAAGKQADFEAINTPDERQKLADSGTPGCIVASSGMLSGGPSAFYARYIARESKSAIFITGYQDEESPGRALLSLAEATDPAERVLRLEGETVQVQCQVGKYSLSAHVDAGEVAGLIEQLDPQETVLVHGAGGAREALSDLLMQSHERRIYLPRASDELTFAGRKSKRPAARPVQPVPENADVSPVSLPTEASELVALRGRLITQLGEKVALTRTLTVQEIAQLWFAAQEQPQTTISAEEYNTLRTLLNEKTSGFLPDNRRPFLYRLQKSGVADGTKDGAEFPLHQNAALLVVDELFPPSEAKQTGLYRRGAVIADQRLILYFYFPGPAAERYGTEIAAIAERTGWTVELNGEAHQEALTQAVGELLPSDFRLLKTPAIYRENQEVRIELAYRGTAEPAPDLSELLAAYRARTGYSLQPNLAGQPPAASVVPVVESEPTPRMEINATYARLDEAFASVGAQLLKRGLKTDAAGQFIELSFVTAQAGEHYRSLIEELQAEVGWSLRISPEPHQQALRGLIERLLSEAGVYARKIGLHRDRQSISLKVEAEPSFDRAALQARFGELTGWQLTFD